MRTAAVVTPLPRAHLEHLREFLESIHSLDGVQAGHSGTVGVPVRAELHGVDDENLNLSDELALETNLQSAEVVADAQREVLHLGPSVTKLRNRLRLLLRHVHLVPAEEGVNLLDGHHDGVDLALAIANLLEHAHDRANVLEILDLTVELERRLAHVVVDGVELLLALLVQVLGKLRLPRRRLRLEGVFHRLRLQAHRADVVHGRDALNVLLDGHVLLELVVERLEARVGGHKLRVL